MTQTQDFMKQVEISLNIFREWDSLTLFEKLCRLKPKPSFADWRIVNQWIANNSDTKGRESEDV